MHVNPRTNMLKYSTLFSIISSSSLKIDCLYRAAIGLLELNFIDFDDFLKEERRESTKAFCNVRKANNGCTSKAYNKYSRLCREDVAKIKALLSEKTNKELAELFCCSAKAISDIRRGATWINA